LTPEGSVRSSARLVTAGVVGRTHGLGGSFYVERPDHPLEPGTVVRVRDREHRVVRRAGTDRKPLVRLDGVAVKEAAAALRGELLLVEATLAEGEWLAEDLVGCAVDGLGTVQRVIDAPSCDLLELEGGELVPLISDAVLRVDLDNREIEIDRRFLRLEGEGA
jgi:16S rRNA processing protein RimM